jgi:DNA polymerase-3 subunit beta
MIVTVPQHAIVEGVKKAGGVVAGKGSVAQLRDIWLEASGSGLTIMASNGNVEFVGTYPADVQEEGLAGVHGNSFVQLVSNLPSGDLQFIRTTRQLHLKAQDIDYDLAISPNESFLPLSPFPSSHPALVSGEYLRLAMERVEFSIAQVPDSPNSCLTVQAGADDAVEFFGTDGTAKLALLTLTNRDLHDGLPASGLLIHRQYLPYIYKLMGSESVEVGISDKRLFLRNTSTDETMSVPLTLGQEPSTPYREKVAAADRCQVHLHLDRRDMVRALTRLQVFVSSSDDRMSISVQGEELVLRLEGTTLAHGTGIERLRLTNPPAALPEGIPRMFKPTLLLETIQHFCSECIDLGLLEENYGAVRGSQDPGYLVMLSAMTQ